MMYIYGLSIQNLFLGNIVSYNHSIKIVLNDIDKRKPD